MKLVLLGPIIFMKNRSWSTQEACVVQSVTTVLLTCLNSNTSVHSHKQLLCRIFLYTRPWCIFLMSLVYSVDTTKQEYTVNSTIHISTTRTVQAPCVALDLSWIRAQTVKFHPVKCPKQTNKTRHIGSNDGLLKSFIQLHEYIPHSRGLKHNIPSDCWSEHSEIKVRWERKEQTGWWEYQKKNSYWK